MKTNRLVMVSTVVAAGLAGLLAACSSASAAHSPTPGTPGSSCGTTRTAGNVPVVIKVVKGTVNCGTALSVENGYAAIVKAGKVHGNGGGAPVRVNGWMCEGYPAPKAALTGNASECHTGSAEVVAEWALPSTGN
ncbi:MAG TPA: hypothetical protein VF482_00680 [Trebonia sp.]